MKNSLYIILLLFIGNTTGIEAPPAPQQQPTRKTAASLKEQAANAVAKRITSFEELNKARSQVSQDVYHIVISQALKNNPKIKEQISAFAKNINSLIEFKEKAKTIAPELYCYIIKEIIKNLATSTNFTHEDFIDLLDKYCGDEAIALSAYATYKLYSMEKMDELTATTHLETLGLRARKTRNQLGEQIARSVNASIEPIVPDDKSKNPLEIAQRTNSLLAVEFFKSMGLK